MIKSKAIDIIKTLSPEEFKRFMNFIISPYFNNTKSIIRLIDELKKHYPEFSDEGLTEEYLYEKVYGKGIYSYSAMKNLLSELINLCENFLVHDRLKKDISKKGINSIELLLEFRERNLNNLFNSRSKKYEKELSNHDIENVEYFIQANKLEILKYQYHLHNHRYDTSIWKGFVNRSSFDMCSIFNTLYMTSSMLIHSAELLKGNPDDSLMVKFVKELDLESFLKKFDPDDSEENFFINFYSKLILLTLHESKDESVNYYFDIKKSFLNNIKYFSEVDIYDVLKSLRSYCITRMRMMEHEFIDELFVVDKLLIEKVRYNSNTIKWFIGELFTEIVHLSIYQKNYKFAENFIEKYSPLLSKEIKDFETGYNRAYLNLEYGNIEKALELLSYIKPVNSSMKLLIKNLYLRAYYDKGYNEEAISILDAYIHYINKENNVSVEKKRNHMLKYNLFLKLFKMKMSPEKYSGHDIINLRKELDKFYFLADKEWYLIKLEELESVIKK